MEDFIKIKYKKLYIDFDLMMVPDLPKMKGINLENLRSKEAFKRAIDIFFGCLLAASNSSSGRFNYVCREVLEYLELGAGEDAL